MRTNDLNACESLDDLAAFLHSQPIGTIRGKLFKLFDAQVDYEDANQWATAVRICEALAIVGWGLRERVDAVSHFNGDCWDTQFINARGESRFRAGKWTKRKAGWVLFNPQYHFSPDRPDFPAIDWQRFAGVKFPTVALPNLPSQRNYRRQMPVIMGHYSGTDKTSESASALKVELLGHLGDAMRPEIYGSALEKFYFTLHTPSLAESTPARLRVGAYNAREKAFYCDLYFDQKFGGRSVRLQQEYFGTNLLAAIDALEMKLKKRGIAYDISRFRADVAKAIEKWKSKRGVS